MDRPARHPVHTVVGARIRALQHGVLKNQSDSVAALARLRRAVGKPTGSDPDVLQYTLHPDLAGPNPPDGPTQAETATHLALTLYAVHQQALREPMHREGREFGLGRSARRLVGGDEIPERHPVLRRFHMLGTSADLDELAHHLRGLVQQLRTARIPLGYATLAEQLLWWQRAAGGPERVRLAWGRDFYFSQFKKNGNTTSESDSPEES
ncbi:type I-E CRISPR-associated protein Cse2/CasB [Amycolatopsis arida]|uniref:type I-E CRISPR-associated protein Cse2/CasB n=1 Tax=Amycolatopsis arida TaxID=587909 RepID=UPI001FBA9C39|nr:type I-E CRISPR-associated protein Cse2/CasB [Amycolatopsis arida]